MNNNTNDKLLQDIKSNGKERNWKGCKIKSTLLAESYNRLRMSNRSERVSVCATKITFLECPVSDLHPKKVKRANFCMDRLCSMCNSRRSLMLHKQILSVLHEASKRQKLRFLFLTLTIKNPGSDELDGTLKVLFEGFHRFFKYKQVDNAVVGWVRTLEVNYDNDKVITKDMWHGNPKKHIKSRAAYYKKHGLSIGDSNPNYNHYHPHFHVLMAVDYTYFDGSSKNYSYIKQEKWAELWQKALQIDYIPDVSIEIVKPKREGQTVEAATAETAKYTVKDGDYIFKHENDTDRVVGILATALKGRRLIGYGKLFYKIKKELKLVDVEAKKAALKDDTEEVECKCTICQSTLIEALYDWNMGIKNYVKVIEDKEV